MLPAILASDPIARYAWQPGDTIEIERPSCATRGWCRPTSPSASWLLAKVAKRMVREFVTRFAFENWGV